MKVWIDDKIYHVTKNYTIFQFCSLIGINLPCFCYHEKLTIAGNCRICLVEVNTAANLVVSCAMPLLDNMRVYTLNKRVRKARESVLEFLLIITRLIVLFVIKEAMWFARFIFDFRVR